MDMVDKTNFKLDSLACPALRGKQFYFYYA